MAPTIKNININNLEIDINQLSHLFGNQTGNNNFNISRSLILTNHTQESVEEIGDIDVYKLPEAERNEIFLLALFYATFQREPTKKELKYYMEMMRASHHSHRRIFDELYALLEESVKNHNRERDKMSDFTIKSLDQWNRVEKMNIWK